VLATATNPDGYIHSYADTYSDPYANSDSDANGYRDSNSYTHDHPQCYADSHFYTYREANAYCQAQDNPPNTANSTTAPVAFANEKETPCSTPTWGREHAKDFGVRPCPP